MTIAQSFPEIPTEHLPHMGLKLHPQPARSRNGFTFLTVIIVLAMLGIAAGVAVLFSTQLLDIRRERMSRDKLEELKQSVTGNTRIVINDGRADFGYIGNMGSLPTSLEDLYKKGSQPAFVFNSTKDVGAGWKGLYIPPLILEHLDSLKMDAFGSDYDYSTTPYTRSDGEVVSAKITSKGADGNLGTSDDRFVEILKREIFATVTGQVTDSGGIGQQGKSVTLNTPENGVLTTKSTTTDVNGNYSFSDVPFGVRSIEVATGGGGPTVITYVSGTAEAVGGGNRDVVFDITNLGQNNITVTSLKAEWPSPIAYYEGILWGATTVWDYSVDGGGVRGGSGETKTFSSSQTISGMGAGGPVLEILRVEEPSTTAPTVIVPAGETVTITLDDFRTNQTGGGGPPVDMGNVNFTITFSDGSIITFTTAP